MDYKDQEFQDFLNEHKALSQLELEGLNFPRKDFKTPQSPGVYSGTLVAKEWGRNMSLISYFELGEDLIDLIKFTTFRNKQTYTPPKGLINLEEATVGESYVLILDQHQNRIFLSQMILGTLENILVERLLNVF